MKVGSLVRKRILVEGYDGFVIESELIGVIIARDIYFNYCDIYLVYFIDGSTSWYNEYNLEIILDKY